jgi:signal transduction histidine kinase
MQPRASMPGVIRRHLTAGTVVVLVLLASVGVASVLAWRAIAEARQRQQVSAAMLRQYAQLAAWEFSREARKDIEMAMTRALAARAHPERHMSREQCDCESLEGVDVWFERPADGALAASGPLPSDVAQDLQAAAGAERGESMEGTIRLLRTAETEPRIVAMRWEPHIGARGGQIGLIVKVPALVPILSRTYRRAALLPPQLLNGRPANTVVHLLVRDAASNTVLASEAMAGPHAFEAELLPGTKTGLQVRASMTPAFVEGLGPEHGAGSSVLLVVGLVGLNGLLVGVGIWQLRRERELARLRADFVAGVSHELRTPLAQIRMFAETLLLDRIRNPQEGRRAIEIIGRETRRLEQLVENVLAFHKHERFVPAGDAEDVDVVALVGDVVDGFGPLASARQATLAFVAPSEEAIVHASADGLRQIMLNLLDNAVKFGPPGQTVRVEVDVADRQVRIALTDEGPGIPVAERERVFGAFQRGRVTHGAGGAGIGLAIVAQIVAAHGGSIAIDGTVLRGTRFVIALPAVAELPAAKTLVEGSVTR